MAAKYLQSVQHYAVIFRHGLSDCRQNTYTCPKIPFTSKSISQHKIVMVNVCNLTNTLIESTQLRL